MIQPLTAIEINSVRELLAKGVQKPRSVSWGDIRYMKKAAPNLLRETGGITTSYTGSRVEFDSNGIRLLNASDAVTVNLDALTGNGTFTGTLTATAGAIGGWTIGATSLLSGTGTSTRAIDSGGTNPAFYAGSATPGSAPFRVSAAGALVATNATITGGGTFSGALSAATGTFAGSLSAATGTFTGSLSAATGSFAGSLSAATGSFSGSISGASGTFTGNLSGSTITSSRFKTAAEGTARIEIGHPTFPDRIRFFDSSDAVMCEIYGVSSSPDFLHLTAGVSGTVRIASDAQLQGALDHDGDTVGFYGVTPVTRQAMSGTSGATLAQLENNVNALIGNLGDLGLLS